MTILTKKSIQTIRRCKPALGTYVEILLSGPFSEHVLLDISQQLFSEIDRIELLMSFHREHSELTQINKSAFYRTVTISQDMVTVIQHALRLSRFSEGIYDITAPATPFIQHSILPNHSYTSDPSANWTNIQLNQFNIRFTKQLQIDLGGIAKGYAVDQAIQACPPDIKACINAGGDMRYNYSTNEPIGIKINTKSGLSIQPVPMQQQAVASSGNYYTDAPISNIISPISKQPIEHPFTVSVFAKDCMTADALTKVIWLMPRCHHILELYEANGYIIHPDGMMTQVANVS